MNNHYVWAAVERIAPQLVTFGVSIVIARMVDPSAYGLIGMLAIFMALGQAFSELGLSSAIIQKKEVNDDDLMTVFVVNVLAGIVVFAFFCALSPLVAKFYHEPLMVPLLCAQSLTFILASLGAVQAAVISREMLFRFNAKVEVFACIVGGSVGVSMAFAGYGVWSLVGLGLSRLLTRVVLLWIFGSWRCQGKFSKESFKTTWAYSSRLLYASLFHRVVTNLYSVIIGRVYSPAALGLYTRAFSLQQMPVGIIGGIVQRVAFPLFSKHQEDTAYIFNTLRRQIRLILAIVATGMAVLCAIAEQLIPWLLGDRWLGAVPLLQILSMAGVFASIFPLHSTVIQALGNSKLFLKVELIKKVYILLMLACVYRFGLEALAWGAVSVSLFDYMASSWPNRKALDYTFRTHLEDLLPTLLACAIPMVCVMLMTWPVTYPLLLTMTLKASVICGFVGLMFVIFRKTYFKDVWSTADSLCFSRFSFLAPLRSRLS